MAALLTLLPHYTLAADAVTSTGVSADGATAYVCATTQLTAPERLYRISLSGALRLSAQLDLEPDADPTGYKQTVCTNGPIVVTQSNASITDQFSKMIETQQAYTANTKVMSTADQMLQDAIAMYA